MQVSFFQAKAASFSLFHKHAATGLRAVQQQNSNSEKVRGWFEAAANECGNGQPQTNDQGTFHLHPKQFGC